MYTHSWATVDKSREHPLRIQPRPKNREHRHAREREVGCVRVPQALRVNAPL